MSKPHIHTWSIIKDMAYCRDLNCYAKSKIPFLEDKPTLCPTCRKTFLIDTSKHDGKNFYCPNCKRNAGDRTVEWYIETLREAARQRLQDEFVKRKIPLLAELEDLNKKIKEAEKQLLEKLEQRDKLKWDFSKREEKLERQRDFLIVHSRKLREKGEKLRAMKYSLERKAPESKLVQNQVLEGKDLEDLLREALG